MASTDPLVEIAKSDLPKLRDLYWTEWPYGVEGYCLLDTHLSYPAFTEIYNFKFYSLEGDVSHGMVAVSNKDYYYEVFVCPTNSTGLAAIENALTKTNVVDWNRQISVPSANVDILSSLKRLSLKLELKISCANTRKYILHKDSKPFEISDPPEGTYVGPLKSEHLNLVNRTWTFYSGQHSYDNFEVLMQNGRTYALYSTDDHRPVSWVTVDNSGALSHLYCLGAHRRKGYSEYVTKVASNDLLAQGKNVLTYTLEDNFKPHNLFTKLGFDFLGSVWWVSLTRQDVGK